MIGLEHSRLNDALLSLGDAPLLIVTGAGMGVASGLPTFRGSDPNAVWAQSVTTMGTFKFFRTDPAQSWAWYLDRFDKLTGANPNAGHEALTALEMWKTGCGGDFLLVTQNIDGLHEAGGTQKLVEVHGRADRVRCASVNCSNGAPKGSLVRHEEDFISFRSSQDIDDLPLCGECGGFLRPHILWFDERYDRHVDYQIGRVLRAAKLAKLVLFVGTSFAVGVTDMIMQRALQRGVSMFSIDPSGRSPHERVTVVAGAAEDILPQTVATLTSAQ